MLNGWICGWRRVQIPAEYAAELLELCRCHGLSYTHFSPCKDSLSLRMSPAVAARCEELCRAVELPLEVGPLRGLPACGLHLLSRPGLIAGLLLGLGLLWLSGRYVWDIRIEGAETLSQREVRETLATCGFDVGTSLQGFAADRLETRVLLADSRIAWISVNRRGTVAYVQLREASYPPQETEPQPANIVASRSGIIERVELIRGNILVAAGQTVGEGQLLVSGLYDSQTMGVRAVCAEAHIYAKTTHREVIEIPLQTETIVPVSKDGTTGGASCEKYLIFFGKTIKFSKSTRNEGADCDKIVEERDITLRQGVGSPVSIRTVWYLPPTETVTLTRTPAEAQELAYLELSRRIAALPGGAELLSKTIRTMLTEDAFILDVTYSCVEDIAVSVPIYVEN